MSGILALVAYVPERVITNADFEAYLDTSDEWIVTRTGIKERRVDAEAVSYTHLTLPTILLV